MSRRALISGIATLFIFLAAIQSHAGTFTAFDSKTFTRSSGKPAAETASFAIKNQNTTFTLKIYNGGTNSEYSKVSSAVISLNGSTIFGESDFNQQVSLLQKQVSLNTVNNLSVELRSSPGSGLAITIEGEDNTPPEVNISSPETGNYTNTPGITVSGTASDSTTLVNTVSVNGTGAILSGESYTAAITLSEGANTVTATATDAGGNTGSSSITVILDTIPPSITLDPVPSLTNNPQLAITGKIEDASPITAITVNGKSVGTTGQSPYQFSSDITLTEGSNTITVTATDKAGNTSNSSITVTLDTIAPVITITLPADGSTVDTSTITVTGTIDDNAATVTVNGINAAVSNNTFTASGITLIKGANTITVTATDLLGNASSTQITVIYALSGLPDPVDVATPIDDTVATTLAAATAFLYSGENPLQTGVAPGTIEAKRAAVLRGKVTANDGTPLPGVKITILDHSEYGSTLTREDGMFDMAVNGGGWLTINYEKTGYLPVQRKVDAPWQDYAWFPDVLLIPFDTKSTVVDLNSNTIQIAQGSTITDADGTRKSTLLFTPGTGATMKLPDNTWVSISNFTVRATR